MIEDTQSLFYNNYTLKTFYNEFPQFNYYLYRQLKEKEFENYTERQVIDYWFNNDRDIILENKETIINKDILIYVHLPFLNLDGGVMVQYCLASELDKLGIRVRILNINDNNANNSVFNNFFDDDLEINKSVVIYCEGIIGNPLNAKYVIRWMLSELGKNVPFRYVSTWGKNELVYYFNSENNFYDNENETGIFKLLTNFYINSDVDTIISKNKNNSNRNGSCYTIRKSFNYRNSYNVIYPENTVEISYSTSFNEYIEIFNKSEFFYCYDPLSFLQIYAIYCGCVCIVYPLENVTKKQWYQKTGLYEYMKFNNLTDINGIAYGNSESEINLAKSTVHLAQNQIIDIEQWNKKIQLKVFINDICHWENNINTIDNIYYSNVPGNEFNSPNKLNYDFYKAFYCDINKHNFNNDEMHWHYCNYGINERRLTCEEHFFALYPDFDLENYKSLNPDLSNLNKYTILNHYHNSKCYKR